MLFVTAAFPPIISTQSDNEQDREEDEESLAREVRDAYTGTPAPVTPQNGRGTYLSSVR